MARKKFLVFLLAFSFATTGAAEAPATIPHATMEQIHQTVDRAIPYLQSESASWLSTRKCAACHHAGMPLWA